MLSIALFIPELKNENEEKWIEQRMSPASLLQHAHWLQCIGTVHVNACGCMFADRSTHYFHFASSANVWDEVDVRRLSITIQRWTTSILWTLNSEYHEVDMDDALKAALNLYSFIIFPRMEYFLNQIHRMYVDEHARHGKACDNIIIFILFVPIESQSERISVTCVMWFAHRNWY